MNPISSARTNESRSFVWGQIERKPFGLRLRVGPFQVVVGYLNRFAMWWNYDAIVDLYRSKPLEPVKPA